MQESFLHYIWQRQYFDKQDLITTEGEVLQILHPGYPNFQAGPDFSNSRIKLKGMEWMGMVEIHVKSSDWQRHQHHIDPAYQQIILHVVWEQQHPVLRENGAIIPTLELKRRINPQLLWRHQNLRRSSSRIPCHHQLHKGHLALVKPMMHQALIERLTHKAHFVEDILRQYDSDWDATTYRILGRNFGFKKNAEAFEQLVKAVPLSIVRKLGPNLLHLEAVLFGQAGLLQDSSSHKYFRLLQREYAYILRKFPNMPGSLPPGRWKFLRMRPANFPTRRIAQFAALMHRQGYRFSWFREIQWPRDSEQLTTITCSQYWQNHYHFGKEASGRLSGLGQSSAVGIMINTAVPLLMTYASYLGKPWDSGSAMALLKQLPPEQNAITSYWKAKGFGVTSAYHSQALLALNDYYCQVKKCLHCSVGISLVKP